MTVREEVSSGRLAELIKKVQAGDEIVLTKDDKPVAKIVPTNPIPKKTARPFHIRSLSGHSPLQLSISSSEIADEMFGQK